MQKKTVNYGANFVPQLLGREIEHFQLFFQRNFKISISEVKVFNNDRYANITYNIKRIKNVDSLSLYVSVKQTLPNKNLKVKFFRIPSFEGLYLKILI
jgi:hypothetical protein